MENRIIDTATAAEMLQVSPRVAARLIATGKIAGRKAGRGFRTTTAALLAYIEGGGQTEPASAGDRNGDTKCQSSSETGSGTVISLHRQARELDALLGRRTSGKRKSCTTG
ncbi:helix-turn-helix domain-containing protein [Aeromonas sp.]|uniref:helix-turn-helix domain-containing protein n=1 Tax=Aeromonas sp. TaxID=647 RepID=UPI00338DF3AF